MPHLTLLTYWLMHLLSAHPQLNNEPRNYDAQYYHIDLQVSVDSEYITGTTECRFKALKAMDALTLDLSGAFRVSKIENAKSWEIKDDKLEINLLQAIPAGQAGMVKIWYRGKPPHVSDGSVTKGLVYNKHGEKKDQPVIASLSTPYLSHLWYPCNDSPSDKVDSVNVDITVKDTLIYGMPLIGISNGILYDSLIYSGKRKYMWRHRYPIAPCYVQLAVSNFNRVSNDYTDPYGNKFPLQFYFFAENRDPVNIVVQRMPDIMDVLSKTFGPYPFAKEKMAVTEIGFFSGMETQSSVMVNALMGKNISTVVHETAHQWFGCSLTCSDWSDVWLNEGFATYAEAIWQEYRRGNEEYMNNIKKIAWYSGGSLHLTDTKDPFKVFQPIVYNKGSSFIHMLRHTMSDKYFFEMLKAYPNDARFKYKNVTADDFQALAQKMSDDDLEALFKEWVYGEGFPVYHYTYGVDEQNNLSIVIDQDPRSMPPQYFIMQITMRVLFEDGTTKEFTELNDKPGQKFTYPIEDKPIKDIVLDPNGWIIKRISYRHAIDNTKFPMELTSYKFENLGRKLNLNINTAKAQDIDISLLNDKSEVVFTQKLTKVSSGMKTVEIPESVHDGAYTLKIAGKSDAYVFDHKIL